MIPVRMWSTSVLDWVKLALCASLFIGRIEGFTPMSLPRAMINSHIVSSACGARTQFQLNLLSKFESGEGVNTIKVPTDKLSASASTVESAETEAQPKRVPIGSAPDFALENDSTEATPYQQAVVALHFALLAANLCFGLSALLPTLSTLSGAASLAGVIVLSVVLGDFGTGVFHWAVDNYGSINTPVVGTVCAAFQGHHETPWTITFRPFANNVYKIAYGTIPTLAFILGLTHAHAAPHAQVFFALFANWWLISQELHKYSHMRKVPQWMDALQSSGLVLSRKEHGLHHSAPFEGHYCILTGSCNALLDESKFFRKLEKVVFQITGNKPITWQQDPSLEELAMTI